MYIIRKGITDMIGRIKETGELNRLYNSGKAELVAIYGGRRIGKTYLVDETFKGRITFRHAGLSPVEKTKAVCSGRSWSTFIIHCFCMG